MELQESNIQALVYWLEDLNYIISEIRAQHRDAIVIAISRKMPKMFEWLSKRKEEQLIATLKETKYTSLKAFVDSLNLTTEQALPFLFKDKNPESYDVVVVDDIIIHGSTLRQVSSDVCALTGKRPIASTIFKCENIGDFPYADTRIIDKMKSLTPEEALKAKDFIAEAIMSSSLPMDIVFPVFHVSENEAKTFANALENYTELVTDHYSINWNNKSFIQSETFMLMGKNASSFNNDFVKCRFFYKPNNDTSIVMYAPNVIEEDILLDGCPFVNDKYKEIWMDIKDHIVDIDLSKLNERMENIIYSFAAENRIKERISLSLAAMANYLFSISIMNRLLKDLDYRKHTTGDFRVRIADLQLLLGIVIASEICSKINDLLKNCEISPSRRERIIVEESICPKEYSERYETSKILLRHDYDSQRSINENVIHNLDSIFDLHRKPERIGLYLSPNVSPETAGIGETFLSLLQALPYLNAENLILMTIINEYIDRKIDEGKISSFYSRTKSPGNVTYIKRYFRAGANSII